MIDSSWALRLINRRWSLVVRDRSQRARAVCQRPTTNDQRPSTIALPIIPPRSLLTHDFFEMRMLAHQHFAEDVVLPHLDRLQPHQFEQCQKYADQRLSRLHTAEHLFKANGAIFEGEAAVQVLDYLANGYRLLGHF